MLSTQTFSSYLGAPFVLCWEHFPPPHLLGRTAMLVNSTFRSVSKNSQFTVSDTFLDADLFSLLQTSILLPEIALSQLSPLLFQLETDAFLSVSCQVPHILNPSTGC